MATKSEDVGLIVRAISFGPAAAAAAVMAVYSDADADAHSLQVKSADCVVRRLQLSHSQSIRRRRSYNLGRFAFIKLPRNV